jgi:hypothetical protein
MLAHADSEPLRIGDPALDSTVVPVALREQAGVRLGRDAVLAVPCAGGAVRVPVVRMRAWVGG